MRRSSRFTSRAISRWIAAAVFFLRRPVAWLGSGRAKGANLLVDADQILAEFLKAMELGNLLLGLA
jgi:hypothetical protein